MAKDSKTILDESVGAFKRLTEQIKAYKDELAQLKTGSEEWTRVATKMRDAQKQVDAINKAAKGTYEQYSKAQANSINALKERIKLLNQERNAMDMNSKEYKEATAELKTLNDQLREAGTSAGDWKANVGNYANSMKDAFSQLGGAANGLTGSIGGLNLGLLKLATNPIGAVIVAITAAIGALAEGIKSSEENTNKWNEAMIPLRTVMVMIERALQNVASKFTDFVKGLRESETAGKVIQGVLRVLITLFEQVKTRITNLAEGIKNVFSKVKEGIGKFKEWGNRLKGTFEPVIDFVDKIKDALKQKLQPAIDWIIDKYNWLAKSDLGKILGMQTIEQIKDSWENAGEVVDELVDKYHKVEDEVEKVVEAENKLGAALRAATVGRAKANREAAAAEREYREEIEKEEVDWEKAQQALDKKKEKEIAAAKAGVAAASAQLDVIRQQNALAGSSSEALMAEAQAAAAVEDAMAAVDEAYAQAAKAQEKFDNKKEAEERKKREDAFKESVAALNQELNKYEAQYTKVVAKIKQPVKAEGADIDKDSINSYYDTIKANAQAEYDAYVELQDKKIEALEKFIETEKALGNDTLQYETQLAKLREENAEGYAKQYEKMSDTIRDADRARAKEQKALQKSEIKGYSDLFDAVSGMFEENTIAYKATATAKALINTFLAATGAFADTPGGVVARGVAMAAAITTGLATVKQIWDTDVKNPNVSNASAPAVAEPVVQENPYSYTRQVQTAEDEDKLNQPIFVRVADIESALARVQVRDQETSY